MEGKAIIYIIGGIVYLIYTFYKNKSEAANQPSHKTTKPVVSNPIEEVLEQMRKAAAPKPQPEAKPAKTQQQVFKGKDIFVREKANSNFEEGMAAYKTFDEEQFKEGESIVKPISEMDTQEAEPVYNFTLRDAVIQSVILERKF